MEDLDIDGNVGCNDKLDFVQVSYEEYNWVHWRQ